MQRTLRVRPLWGNKKKLSDNFLPVCGCSMNLGESLELAVEGNCALRDPSPFILYLNGSQLNQRELIGVCKTLESSQAIGLQALDALWISVGEHVARHNKVMCSEALWDSLRPRLDAGLSRLWPRMRSHGSGLHSFVGTYVNSLALLGGAADLNKVMATGGQWLKAIEEARRLVKKSQACMALFGFILDMLKADALETIFSEHLAKFDAYQVSDESLASLEAGLADTMEQYRSASALQKQRYIGVKWMDALVKVQISGVVAEFSLRKAALIKAAALSTRTSGLTPLLYERWLLESQSDAKFEAPPGLLKPWQDARNYVADVLSRHQLQCVADVVKLVGSVSADVIRLDPSFTIELTFIQCHLESALQKAVQRSLMRCLPDEERRMTITESIEAVEKFCESEACQVSDQESHQKSKALLDALQTLAMKNAPAHELFAKDPWFAVVLTNSSSMWSWHQVWARTLGRILCAAKLL